MSGVFMLGVRKIVSGGQTGVDRAALDFALEHGIETGGYVPKDRRAEDGPISDKYPNLTPTASGDYKERTGLNVKSADATLIISQGTLKGGSQLTKLFAEKYKKPFLHIDLFSTTTRQAAENAKEWLAGINCEVLNIAGPRASEDKEIYTKTKQFLDSL